MWAFILSLYTLPFSLLFNRKVSVLVHYTSMPKHGYLALRLTRTSLFKLDDSQLPLASPVDAD